MGFKEMVKLLLATSCFLYVQLVLADNGQQWITQDEFANRLPASLSPIYSTLTQTSGECFFYCVKYNCSSVAYSSTYQSCKVYSHPNLAKPLPSLVVDPTGFQHQMYYSKSFCPVGWVADSSSGKCYYMDMVTQVRTAAWQVCEEHLMSEMAMFKTPSQRDNLYKILSEKYGSTTKWWTGYALFDSQLWPRPIDELPGYRSFRGECQGYDIANFTISQSNCALKCDRTYRDRCVGFIYDGINAKCWLKYKMCDNNANNRLLGTEFWGYEKIHAGRPMTLNDNLDITINTTNIATYNDVSLAQCKGYAANSLNTVHVAYYSSSRTCNLHRSSNTTKVTCSNCVSFDKKDINDGWCPYGVRYRDVCLVFLRTKSDWYTLEKRCRTQGGKYTRPVDGIAKSSYASAVGVYFYIDWTEDGHLMNYTTLYDGLTLGSSLYKTWGWESGNPSHGSEHCGASFGVYRDSTGSYVKLNDISCTSFSINAVCEFPITQSYPKDCRFTPMGREYMGQLSKTISGISCQSWSSVAAYNTSWRKFSDWYTSTSYCRNPDATVFGQPWCYRSDNGSAEICDIPMCPESDWAPSQIYDAPEQPYAAITQTNTQADSYYWTVEDIASTANALCQMEMDSWCPYYFRGSCYQLYKLARNHSEAQAVCYQNGWHLATVTSRDEQLFLMGITQRLGHQWILLNGYHIGLYWNMSNWIWETGDTYSEINVWQGGLPGSLTNVTCAYVNAKFEGWWSTIACWYKQWFICEIELIS